MCHLRVRQSIVVFHGRIRELTISGLPVSILLGDDLSAYCRGVVNSILHKAPPVTLPQLPTQCFPQFRDFTFFGSRAATHIRLQVHLCMHKVTHRSSVPTRFSIPLMAEASTSAVDWSRASNETRDTQLSEAARLDPLYLFACGLFWHKHGDAAAAWELIHGLHSADQGTCVVASALLTKRRTPREIGAAQARRIGSSRRCES
jgi:hypothetical protein